MEGDEESAYVYYVRFLNSHKSKYSDNTVSAQRLFCGSSI